MKSLFAFILLLNLSMAGAQTSQEHANLAQKIIHVLDNSTVGAIQTIVGASHVLVYLVLSPLPQYDLPRFGMHKNPNSEVTQITIENEIPWYDGHYSLGLFQLSSSDWVRPHEGGHSVESAALGPLYLPAVALSYLIEGEDSSFLETWADIEAKPNPYISIKSGMIGVGRMNLNNQISDVVVLKFNLEQRQLGQSHNVATDKVFQWLNTQIVLPVMGKTNSDPFLVEFDLLKKSINVIFDNVDIYAKNEGLRASIQTEQRYLHIENNPLLERVHVKALDWQARFGVQYNFNRDFSIGPHLGVGLSLDGMSKGPKDLIDRQFAQKSIYTAAYSLSSSVDLKAYDYVTLRGKTQRDIYLNGMKNTLVSATISNELRKTRPGGGLLQKVNLSAGYQQNKLELPNTVLRSNQLNLSLGIKF